MTTNYRSIVAKSADISQYICEAVEFGCKMRFFGRISADFAAYYHFTINVMSMFRGDIWIKHLR